MPHRDGGGIIIHGICLSSASMASPRICKAFRAQVELSRHSSSPKRSPGTASCAACRRRAARKPWNARAIRARFDFRENADSTKRSHCGCRDGFTSWNRLSYLRKPQIAGPHVDDTSANCSGTCTTAVWECAHTLASPATFGGYAGWEGECRCRFRLMVPFSSPQDSRVCAKTIDLLP